MIVRARAPLRLGLAGGGTDVSPYCDQYGGYVLNATIDRYAYAVIRPLSDERVVRFIATDRQAMVEHPADNPLPKDTALPLHCAIYEHMIGRFHNGRRIPIEVSSFCDAPVGSGLGASSTLVVAMVRAYAEFLNTPLDDYTTAQIAFTIERVECGLHGGRQDQYAAVFGGFNFIEFHDGERAIVNQLRIKEWVVCELEASLLLFFSGVSRESATIIAEKTANVSAGVGDTLEAMHRIKREAVQMKECLLRGDLRGVVDSIHAGWESKKRTARAVSNEYLDEIYSAALRAGALAGRVSGAGGGGFMLFFVPTEKRMAVVETLRQFNGEVSNCHFTMQGTQAWRVL